MAPKEPQTQAPSAPAPGKTGAGAAAAKPQPEGRGKTRREFNWLALAWTAFTAASVAGLTATMRFMFPNVLFEPPTLFKAGYPDSYKPGEVDERFKEKYGVWIIRGEDKKISDAIKIGFLEGMVDFTENLRQLVERGDVSKEVALEVAPNPEALKMALKGIKVATPGIL